MGRITSLDNWRASQASRNLTTQLSSRADIQIWIGTAATRGGVLRPVTRIKERIEHLSRSGLTCHTLQQALDDYEPAISAFESLCPPNWTNESCGLVSITTTQSSAIRALQDGLASLERRVALTEWLYSEIHRLERASGALTSTIVSQDYSPSCISEWTGLAFVGGSNLVIEHSARLIGLARAKLLDGDIPATERYVLEADEFISSALQELA